MRKLIYIGFDYQSECHCTKTYAVSTVGIKEDELAAKIYQEGLTAAIKALSPKRLLVYGGMGDFDYGDIEIVEYSTSTAFGGK